VKITKHLSERNYLFLAITWAVLIAVLSLVSLKSIPKEYIYGNDKVMKFIYYDIFVVLLSFAKSKSYFKMKHNLFIIFIVIIYGIVIEILQGVITKNREADIYDAIANSLGAIVGFILVYCVKNKVFNKFF